MTGSMYAAIAGLKTHMQNMSVIGNNVANVNTASYKAGRAVFKTSIYTSLSGGSDGTNTVGGTNPSQIGYGANVATVDIDMSTGNYNVTGKATDLMLDGDGFFLVGDKTLADNFDGTYEDVNRLTALTLTRRGSFDFKSDGYLTDEAGNVVYGFMCIGIASQADVIAGRADEVGKPMFSDQLVPIRFPKVETVEKFYNADGEEIEGAVRNADGTLPADAETSRVVTQIAYASATAGGIKDAQKLVGKDDDGNDIYEDLGNAQFTGITVDPKTGLITGTSNDTGETVTIGCVAVGSVTNPNGVTQIGDTYYKAGPGSGDLTINVLGGAAESMRIFYINGSLVNKGDNLPKDVPAADAEDLRVDGLRARTGGGTGIIPNGLEMSKTDLAQEIVNMILTQRGYQANTRIITVTDTMLEELVNMKR